MKLIGLGATDVGCKRETNQDSFLVDDSNRVYILADGMGGHLGGEVASSLATKTIHEYILSKPEEQDYEVKLRCAIQAANSKIHEKSNENPEMRGMGTTAIVLSTDGQALFIGHVGDSRVYLINSGEMWQVTEDHSLVNEQIKAGIITPEEAKVLSHKNVITRSIGYESEVKIDIYKRDLKKGEKYLICSDGLSGMLSEEEILEICNNNTSRAALPLLLEAAKSKGGDDNITVILVSISE